MAQQAPRDLIERIRRLEDKIRRLELRVRAKGGNKVYIVGGTIVAGLYVPPFDMAVGAPDGTITESREVVGFRGKLRTGVCDVRWELNGSVITDSAFEITTTWTTILLDDAVPVVDADDLQLIITGATAAADLSAGVLLASRTI